MAEENRAGNEGGSMPLEHVAGKYLTFKLDDEVFGFGILNVHEIIGNMAMTRMPKVPPFVRGVINLRGRVIPVIDLRVQFDLAFRDDTEHTCIIVLQVLGPQGEMKIGVVVDEVSEVVDIQARQIEAVPAFGAHIDTSFMLGMAKMREKVVTLLDTQCIFSKHELENVGQLAGAGCVH